MATKTNKARNRKYLNRDFEGYKKDLVEHLKVYFPDTFSDFNESNVGMMFTEIVSFIGDNLSFYLDKRVNESFLETSREASSGFKHAKQLGLKPFGKSAAIGKVDGFIKVPARTVNQEIIPDMRYAGIIRRGAKLKSAAGETYETLVEVDFSDVDIHDPSVTQVGDRDSETDQPKTFVLRVSGIEIKAGETKSTTFSVGSYESFKRLILPDEDVLEVIQITDSEGNEWFEVDYLVQDIVFSSVDNNSADSADVPYVLKLKSVPYRFITEYNPETNKTSLIFGTGDADNFDGDLIPNLGDLSLPLYGKATFTDFSIDPQNFLKTRTLGLAPVNTTLTVKYRVGGGPETDAGSNEIDTVADVTFDIGDSTLSSTTINDVGNSFSVINPGPIQGGRDILSADEIKHIASANFAAQSRVVTPPDFIVRALSMPTKFGSVFRASARASSLNKNAVELMILSKNSDGHVTEASATLKENLKKYLSRFRMVTDAIEILDGEIIDIAIQFEVLTFPDFNKSEVVSNCIADLKEFFLIDKFQINQPINLTDIYTLLADVPGVLSVIRFDVINRIGNFDGRSYSTTPYNIKENTENGIIYCKSNAIFQVKYVNKDISGASR